MRGTLASSANLQTRSVIGFNAVLGVDQDHGGFNGKQGGAGFVTEHVEAGRVDEVDFDALPLGKGHGVLHGCAAGHLFFVIGGDGRAVVDAALGWGHLGGMQQSGDQGGFAAVRMPHYSYVADLTSLVRFHGFSFELKLMRDVSGKSIRLRSPRRLRWMQLRGWNEGGAGKARGRPGGRPGGRIGGPRVPVCRLPRP